MQPIGPDQHCTIRLSKVSKSFGGIDAVCDVDMYLPEGENRALIGPNGAGKSTLFSLISGETPLDRGRIEIFNQDLTSAPVQRRIEKGVGRTYQTSNLFTGLTVRENLFLSVWKRGATPASLLKMLLRPWQRCETQCQQLEEVACQVGLIDQIDTRVQDMSHGEHRQLELAMTLAHQPKVLLLDEPMAGLSANERVFMTELIMDLGRQMTLLVIEHDIDIAFAIADQVSVLHQGRVIAEGTPAEVKTNSDVQGIYTLSQASHGDVHD